MQKKHESAFADVLMWMFVLVLLLGGMRECTSDVLPRAETSDAS